MTNIQKANGFQFKDLDNNSLLTINNNQVIFHSAGSIILPAGSTADRPLVPIIGMIRYNTDLQVLEFYNGSIWVALNNSSFQVPFTQTTTVLSVSGGIFTGRVLNVTVLIETPFNGTGFSFNLGTNINPSILLEDNLIDLTTPNVSNYAIINKEISGEIIQATIDAGTGSLGTGIIIVEFAL